MIHPGRGLHGQAVEELGRRIVRGDYPPGSVVDPANFQRVWVDPAGRIVIAHDIDTLSVLFPTGVIPPDVARKIPAGELSEAEREE